MIVGNTKMLWRRYSVWRVDSHHCLASLDPTLQSELPMSWCTYTHNTHPVASAHVKKPPDCPVCPEPGWEKQEWWDPHNRHSANRQGNKGETQCAKTVSHVALDEVEPLISLSRCEGRVLILTYVHNWLFLLSTHDASSVGVYSSKVIYVHPWGENCVNIHVNSGKSWMNTNENLW